MAAPSPAARSPEDPVWRMRWLLLGSCLCVAFAITAALIVLPTKWHWGPLWWGIVITLVTLAVRQLVMSVLIRRTLRQTVAPPGALDRFRRRERIYIPLWVFIGLVFSVIAAAFNLIWIVLAMAAFMLLSLGGGALAAAVVQRRRSAAG